MEQRPDCSRDEAILLKYVTRTTDVTSQRNLLRWLNAWPVLNKRKSQKLIYRSLMLGRLTVQLCERGEQLRNVESRYKSEEPSCVFKP